MNRNVLSSGKTEFPSYIFLWVKMIQCRNCGMEIDPFPGYLVSSNSQHPQNVFLCPTCGQLTETRKRTTQANALTVAKLIKRSRRRNQCGCQHCKTVNYFPDKSSGPPRHRLFALEYYCPSCKKAHIGRFFKAPNEQDLKLVGEAETRFPQQHPLGTLPRIAGLSTRTQRTNAGGCSIAPVVQGSVLPTNRLCATAPAT